jgi:hypothetical protein
MDHVVVATGQELVRVYEIFFAAVSKHDFI